MAEMTGAELRESRHKLGLSQQTLAERLGVSLPTISRWETGALTLAERGDMLRLALRGLECEAIHGDGITPPPTT